MTNTTGSSSTPDLSIVSESSQEAPAKTPKRAAAKKTTANPRKKAASTQSADATSTTKSPSRAPKKTSAKAASTPAESADTVKEAAASTASSTKSAAKTPAKAPAAKATAAKATTAASSRSTAKKSSVKTAPKSETAKEQTRPAKKSESSPAPKTAPAVEAEKTTVRAASAKQTEEGKTASKPSGRGKRTGGTSAKAEQTPGTIPQETEKTVSEKKTSPEQKSSRPSARPASKKTVEQEKKATVDTLPNGPSAVPAEGKNADVTEGQEKQAQPAKRQHASQRGRGATKAKNTASGVQTKEIPAVTEEATVSAADNQDSEAPSTASGRGRQGQRRRSHGRREKKPVVETPASEAWEVVDPFFDMGMESVPPVSDLDDDVTEAQNGNKKSENRPQPQPKEDPAKTTRRKMFVSIVPEEQVEVVLTVEGQVHEYYVEMLHQAKTKGNIYKGVINNVDANLQAAFVNYGAVKNGFLQIDEVHPEYYGSPHESGRGHKYPSIQKVLKPGQEVLVQVVKEPTGNKGAFLTTYLSLAGRFLVLTPGREQVGVSRKVDDDTERARLREMLNGLNPGPGLGVIVRTVSVGASKANLESDLAYLKRIWNDIRTRGIDESAPSLIYQELDLGTRAVRDYLTDDVVEVWLDDEKAGRAIADLARNLFPRKKNLLRVHQENSPLFERFNLQRQLEQIHSREVVLPSGGRLVIDPTEALTAIDINSGRSSGKSNFEDMAYRTNLEAARMIPLQLRLRDIGGQVVVDFIEMRDKNHWREVERALRNGMKVDRARFDVGRISAFGMMEIVRQRLGSSAISVSTEPCPYCRGTGVRRNMEWQCQQALRDIARVIRELKPQEKTSPLLYEAEADVALYLLNFKRQRLLEMEQANGISIEIKPN